MLTLRNIQLRSPSDLPIRSHRCRPSLLTPHFLPHTREPLHLHPLLRPHRNPQPLPRLDPPRRPRHMGRHRRRGFLLLIRDPLPHHATPHLPQPRRGPRTPRRRAHRLPRRGLLPRRRHQHKHQGGDPRVLAHTSLHLVSLHLNPHPDRPALRRSR